MLCAKFEGYWPSGSAKDFKCLQCIFVIWLIFHRKKRVALHLNKLESPSHKDVDRQTDDGRQAIRYFTVYS